VARIIHRTLTATQGQESGVEAKAFHHNRPHSKKHPPFQEQIQHSRVGGDGRRVDRVMVNAREHDPPYKWHRVIDRESGTMIKNELIDHSTGERWDFRDPSVNPPGWFPTNPRAV
jgi:hypothetical protein